MAQKRASRQVTPTEGSSNGHPQTPVDTALPPAEVEAETLEDTPQASVSGLQRYALADDYDDEEGELLVTSCPVRRPTGSEWFRCRPGDLWQLKTLIVDFRAEHPALTKGAYLILGARLQQAFRGIGRPHLLRTCVTESGGLFLWPIRITEGFGESWYKSALRIADRAETAWTQYRGSSGNAYEAKTSTLDRGTPRWRGKDLEELLAVGFDGRLVETAAHPLCRHFEVG
jgi:hypothetical protein